MVPTLTGLAWVSLPELLLLLPDSAPLRLMATVGIAGQILVAGWLLGGGCLFHIAYSSTVPS